MVSSIGEILKAGRQRAGMNQEELASKLYIDRAIISRIETGTIERPSYMIVKEWARICKCEDLISFDLAGEKNAWKELMSLQQKLKQIKELVSMFRVKQRKEKRRDAKVNRLGAQ